LFDSKNNEAIYYSRSRAKEIHEGLETSPTFDYDRQFMAKSEVDDYNSKLGEIVKAVVECERYFEGNKLKYTSKDIIDNVKVLLGGEMLAVKEDMKHYLVDYIREQIAITEATAN